MPKVRKPVKVLDFEVVPMYCITAAENHGGARWGSITRAVRALLTLGKGAGVRVKLGELNSKAAAGTARRAADSLMLKIIIRVDDGWLYMCHQLEDYEEFPLHRLSTSRAVEVRGRRKVRTSDGV